jgi:hypothetical protein
MALEAALQALADRVAAPDPEPAAVAPTVAVGEGITRAELAERTGTNRAASNNWAKKANKQSTLHPVPWLATTLR